MKMGCSSSMNQPTHHKRPLANGMLIHNGISNGQTMKSSQMVDHQNNNSFTNNNDNKIHINSTEIVIFTHNGRDPHHTCQKGLSSDSSSVVPILNNDIHQDSTRLDNYNNTCLNNYNNNNNGNDLTHKDANSNNVHGVKSVLKTHRNDLPSHMISSRPIKSVTFVDSVTVVTVY